MPDTIRDRIAALVPDASPETVAQIVALARELEPLEWTHHEASSWWDANNGDGLDDYRIIYDTRANDYAWFYRGRWRIHPTLEAAKAAAEAHRAAQIRWRE